MPRGEVVNLKIYQRIVTIYEVMHKWDAVGLSERILLNLRHHNIHIIRIIRLDAEGGTDKIFYTTVDAFLNSDMKHYFMKDDLNLHVRFSDMLAQGSTIQTKLKNGVFENVE